MPEILAGEFLSMASRLIKVQFKRRAKRKTDYEARERMLMGNVPRLIIRRTNRYIIAQIAESKAAQDKVMSHTLSKEIIKYGYPEKYSMKNLAAAYLTGFLAASKIGKKVKKGILDLGMHKSTKGNRLYAALKGAIDGGMDIPHSEKMLPTMEMIKEKSEIDLEKIKSAIKEKFA